MEARAFIRWTPGWPNWQVINENNVTIGWAVSRWGAIRIARRYLTKGQKQEVTLE